VIDITRIHSWIFRHRINKIDTDSAMMTNGAFVFVGTASKLLRDVLAYEHVEFIDERVIAELRSYGDSPIAIVSLDNLRGIVELKERSL
jgi:hypothetical protein